MKLPSLRRRRLRGYLSETFELTGGFITIFPKTLFTFREPLHQKEHIFTSTKSRSNTLIWNGHPHAVLESFAKGNYMSNVDRAWSFNLHISVYLPVIFFTFYHTFSIFFDSCLVFLLLYLLICLFFICSPLLQQ